MDTDSRLVLELVIALMACLTTGLVLWGLFGPRTDTSGKLEERIIAMGLRQVGLDAAETDDEARSREAMQRALQELESLRKTEARSALQRLLNSSGTERSQRKHLVISLAVALLGFLVATVLGLNPVVAGILGTSLGVVLPVMQLRVLVNRRMAVFSEDLPGTLDLIVRGIRAGLPLIDCIKMTAVEWREPLRSEYLQVLNDLGVGLNIRTAISRFADRVGLQEARLFAIVIAIQSQSGGNLSEVLSNLADLLRERSKLVQKIRAMTSEARTSAWIIGAIPILILGAVTVLSPDYLKPLFDTTTGNLILAGCGGWMLMGMLVMRSMMRVDL